MNRVETAALKRESQALNETLTGNLFGEDDEDEEEIEEERILEMKALKRALLLADGKDGDSPEEEVTWNQRYMEAVAYKRTHGHVHVNSRRDPKLGVWISKQRSLKGAGHLSHARQRKLEELGIEWDGVKAKRSREDSEVQAQNKRTVHQGISKESHSFFLTH